MGGVHQVPPLEESPPRYLGLGADLLAARRARKFLSLWCEYLEVREPHRYTVLLLVSELVTNAVQHGVGDVSLVVTSEAATIRMAVYDDSPDRPTTRWPAAGSVGGRGLFVVDQLAADWGVELQVLGKAVWCRVAF